MSTAPTPIVLKDREVVRLGNDIVKRSSQNVFCYDTALNLVDNWYANVEPRIDAGSRIDVAFMILYLSFGQTPISHETVREKIRGMYSANRQAVERTTKCLLEAQKKYQSNSQ